MSRQNPGAFPLLDLLARQWRLPAPALSVGFDGSSRALVAPLADGRVALIVVEDSEPPESRIAVDETGRRTIAPRRGEPKPAIVLTARGEGPAKVAAAHGEGFVMAHGDGSLSRSGRGRLRDAGRARRRGDRARRIRGGAPDDRERERR